MYKQIHKHTISIFRVHFNIFFIHFRALRVPRIAIHKNLFASLLLHCVSMITFKCAIFLPYIQDGKPQNSFLEQVSIYIFYVGKHYFNYKISNVYISRWSATEVICFFRSLSWRYISCIIAENVISFISLALSIKFKVM